MRFANVRDLRNNCAAILRKLSTQDVVITRRGKPVAAVIYMNEDLLDSFILAHHPTLMDGIRQDLGRWRGGRLRAHPLEEVRQRLLKGARRRRRGA